ncbi:MAG: mechanosensitive ion channel [Desulfurococcales archaeon]|nr:mechanosensitive ion channel [Desulfurococcales archaeon]MCE4626198.1 mechanosensitive ion channel [Desulfurococcales archaeon]MCE4629297.1 mechanosensitive ion channel [Desulfurococcales archaeon]
MDASVFQEIWSAIASGTYMVRVLESLILIVIILIFLNIIKKLIFKIGGLSGADQRAMENTYKIIELSLIIITLFLVLFLLTQQSIIVQFILGIVLVIFAASWETIANVASYYAILLTQAVTVGEYIALEGCEGKVRKITVLYTIIDGYNKVCTIPNRVFLSKLKSTIKEPVYAKFRVRIWGFEDVDVAEDITAKLKERLYDIAGSVTAIPGEARIYIEELSPDAVTASLLIPHPGHRIQPEKVGLIVREIATILKEYGYPFNISLERQNGGVARWKGLA